MAGIVEYLKVLSERLIPGEKVEAAVLGVYSTKQFGLETSRDGIMVATDQRVMLCGRRLKGSEIVSVAYDDVIRAEPGSLFGLSSIVVHARQKVLHIHSIGQGDAKGLMELVDSRAGSKGFSVPPTRASMRNMLYLAIALGFIAVGLVVPAAMLDAPPWWIPSVLVGASAYLCFRRWLSAAVI